MSIRSSLKKLAFGLLVVIPLAMAATACLDDPVRTFNETLVAPPGVPARPAGGPEKVVIDLHAIEQQAEIAPGVTYTEWTFNGSVPGPMLRVRVGDQVEVHLSNAATNTSTHNIDLHAVNGPGGGAGVTTVAPGESKAFSFQAMAPGLYVYHCAAGIVADHIANGMYGGILVEPEGGLPTVDHEYYIGQSEFYTSGDTGVKGAQDLDFAKLASEDPTYVVWNGNTQSLNGDKALTAKPGETVRIYVANGGPNFTSSFHVIGEIFDKAWDYGGLTSPPLQNIQTVTVPPGGATVVQFKVDVPGDYKLVDHAISRLAKGAVGTLHVTGQNNDTIFQSLSGVTGAAATGHDMTMTPAPGTATAAPTTAPATPTPAASATGAPATGNPQVSMKDNLFTQTAYTVKAGQPVTFNITNDGKVPHNMRVAAPDGNFDAPTSVVSNPEIITPGKTATLTFTPNAPGTYKFRCDLHPDQMTGTITVQ